jgi:arsenite-transporting ATPase
MQMTFADILYGERDARASFVTAPAYRVRDPERAGAPYRLELKLPFVEKGDIDLGRTGASLAIKIGPFRRVILLPRILQPLTVTGAKLLDDQLSISFGAA